MRELFIAAAVALACQTAGAQQPQRAPSCETAEHRAFDFWLGEWDAYVTGAETLAGRSTIAREDGGCVLTEHWRSTRQPYTGRSLNIYDRTSGKWEQFWVNSTGTLTHFIGGPENGAMRLLAERAPSAQQPRYTRMTFTPNPDGSVRQHGETSADGVAWTTTYDFTYRRRAGG